MPTAPHHHKSHHHHHQLLTIINSSILIIIIVSSSPSKVSSSLIPSLQPAPQSPKAKFVFRSICIFFSQVVHICAYSSFRWINHRLSRSWSSSCSTRDSSPTPSSWSWVFLLFFLFFYKAWQFVTFPTSFAHRTCSNYQHQSIFDNTPFTTVDILHHFNVMVSASSTIAMSWQL